MVWDTLSHRSNRLPTDPHSTAWSTTAFWSVSTVALPYSEAAQLNHHIYRSLGAFILKTRPHTAAWQAPRNSEDNRYRLLVQWRAAQRPMCKHRMNARYLLCWRTLLHGDDRVSRAGRREGVKHRCRGRWRCSRWFFFPARLRIVIVAIGTRWTQTE